MSTLPDTLRFSGTPITLVDRHGEPWVTAADLACALGYQPLRRGKGDTKVGAPSNNEVFTLREIGWQVTKLYNRHADEFADEMTALMEIPTLGGRQAVRIFSPRGCHLIAMFSRTERAKAFRRWVLDVLERHIRGSGPDCRLTPLLALTRGRWGTALTPGGYNAVSLTTAKILEYLLDHYGDGRWCAMSLRGLGREIGIHRNSVSRALLRLEDWGLVESGPHGVRPLAERIRADLAGASLVGEPVFQAPRLPPKDRLQ